MPVNSPVLYHNAVRNAFDALHPSLWRGIQLDWVPLLRFIPFIDMGYGKHNMSLSGTGITYEISEDHGGLPVGRHTGSSGHLEHPRIVGFDLNDDDIFTVGIRVSVTDTAGDERTLFAKRLEGGATQTNLRTASGTPPQGVQVTFGSAIEVTSASVIENNTPYTVFLMNTGTKVSGGITLEIYDATGSLLDTASGTSNYNNNTPEAPFWLFAAFSNTNDPMVGDHAGARGWNRILTPEERQIQAEDWHVLYRRRVRVRRGVVAAPVGGRIMSSLVGAGGLAGMGGIAGQGGGLAA